MSKALDDKYILSDLGEVKCGFEYIAKKAAVLTKTFPDKEIEALVQKDAFKLSSVERRKLHDFINSRMG